MAGKISSLELNYNMRESELKQTQRKINEAMNEKREYEGECEERAQIKRQRMAPAFKIPDSPPPPPGRRGGWDLLTELERNPDYGLDPYSSWLAEPEKLRPTRCPFDAEPHKHLRSLSPPKYRNRPIHFFTPEEADLLNRVGGVETVFEEMGFVEMGTMGVGIGEMGCAGMGFEEMGFEEMGFAEMGFAEMGFVEMGIA